MWQLTHVHAMLPRDSFVITLFLIWLFTLIDEHLCLQTCHFYDNLNEETHIVCSTGCCGTRHIAYCCITSNFSIIVFGSVIGFCVLLLIVLTAVVLYCRRNRNEPSLTTPIRDSSLPNYGSARSLEHVAINDASDEDAFPGVNISITPATPTTT